MAGEDRILKILLQIQSDISGLTNVRGGLSDVRKETEDTAKSAFGLRQAFEFAGAEEALRRTIDVIKEIGREVEDRIKQGVEWTAELQQIQIGFAAVLQTTQGNRFIDFESAKNEAAGYVDTIKEKANELGIAYRDMFESVQHTQAQLATAGVTDINKAIELTVILNRAMQAVGVGATQAARDIGDILQGQVARTLGGPRLASAIGMTKEDFDLAIQQAIQTGQLYDFIKEKLGAFQTAAEAGSHTFQADVNRMQNAILDFETQLAQPIMEPLTAAIERFTAVLKTDDAQAWARTLSQSFVEITKGIVEGITQLSKFKDLLQELPGFGIGQAIGGAIGSAQQSNVQQIQLESLQKQTAEIQKQIGLATTQAAQSLARDDLMSLEATVQEQITAEKNKGKDADQGVLSVLFAIYDQLRQIQAGFSDIAGTAEQAAAATRGISAALQKVLDTQGLLHAETYGSEADIYSAKWVQAYHTIEEEAKRAGQQLTQQQLDQLTYEKLRGPERAKELSDAEKESGVQKDITAFLREDSLLMTQIHNAQQLISANPFLSVDQKQQLSVPLLITEIQQLNAEIQKGQALMHGGTLDPAQYDQVGKAVDNLRTKVQLLQYQLQTSTFGGGFAASLTQWANSFGTAAQQAASVLTGTLNTAIGSTSQALTGLIFGTKNWQQAFLQAAQSIVQSIIKIALQFVISRLLMSVLNRAAGTEDTGAATASAGTAAAAWSPAAVSASIATYGTAAGTGLAAYLAALAAGTAAGSVVSGVGAAGGGYELGGYTGDGGGFVHPHEYVFSAPAVRNIGVENLEAAHRSARSLSSGAVTASSSPASGRAGQQNHHFALFYDKSQALEHLKDREGTRTIIDIVRGEKIQLGI